MNTSGRSLLAFTTNEPPISSIVQGRREAALRHWIAAAIQAPWTARQSSPTIRAQSPNQTNALKPKIGERTTNIPILPGRPSWLLQYLAKSQIRYPGNVKAIRSPRRRCRIDQGGGKRRAIIACCLTAKKEGLRQLPRSRLRRRLR